MNTPSILWGYIGRRVQYTCAYCVRSVLWTEACWCTVDCVLCTCFLALACSPCSHRRPFFLCMMHTITCDPRSVEYYWVNFSKWNVDTSFYSSLHVYVHMCVYMNACVCVCVCVCVFFLAVHNKNSMWSKLGSNRFTCYLIIFLKLEVVTHACHCQLRSIQDSNYVLRKACKSSEVLPTLPLKWFQCSSDWWWPSCPFKEDRLALPPSMPLSSRQSVVWCPWPCACR